MDTQKADTQMPTTATTSRVTVKEPLSNDPKGDAFNRNLTVGKTSPQVK